MRSYEELKESEEFTSGATAEIWVADHGKNMKIGDYINQDSLNT